MRGREPRCVKTSYRVAASMYNAAKPVGQQACAVGASGVELDPVERGHIERAKAGIPICPFMRGQPPFDLAAVKVLIDPARGKRVETFHRRFKAGAVDP